jgi:hypothetical protein
MKKVSLFAIKCSRVLIFGQKLNNCLCYGNNDVSIMRIFSFKVIELENKIGDPLNFIS